MVDSRFATPGTNFFGYILASCRRDGLNLEFYCQLNEHDDALAFDMDWIHHSTIEWSLSMCRRKWLPIHCISYPTSHALISSISCVSPFCSQLTVFLSGALNIHLDANNQQSPSFCSWKQGMIMIFHFSAQSHLWPWRTQSRT